MADHDAIADFITAMEAAGIRPVEPIAQALASGKLVRFRAEGDGPGRQNGWAIIHLDERPAGSFGHYKLGVTETWRSGRTEQLSPAERRERARQWREAREQREADLRDGWTRTAAEAQRLWAGAKAASNHPYLAKKAMDPAGLRHSGKVLLVPMLDEQGVLWNLQRIFGDGTKRFLKGGRTVGLAYRFGQPRGRVIIAEGIATAAALHRATGDMAVAAFSAKNLRIVAEAVRERLPRAEIIIAADDDGHLENNIGLEAARAAAQAVGGRVALPPKTKD